MRAFSLSALAVLFILCQPAWSQTKKYSIVIKGGHVIDPKNNIDAVMDVAIEGTPAFFVGDAMIPGATAFTVMPRLASSSDSAFVALFSAPLAAA